MRTYKWYFYRLMVLALVLVVGVVSFNVLVDPYGIWQVYQKVGFNQYHTHRENFERVGKPVDVMRLKPRVIFVGSSRVKFGLDPEYYSELTGESHVYNSGVNGANIYVVRRLLEHAVLNCPDLKEVVLGLDFMMFNEKWPNQQGFDDAQLSKTHISKSNYLLTTFSVDALKASIDCISLNRQERRTYDVRKDNGMGTDEQAFYYHRWGLATSLRDFTRSARDYSNDPGLYKDYRLSESYFDNLRKIVALCRERNIQLHVYISPIHALQSEGILVADSWDEYEKWKREVAKVVAYYDFSDYTEITTEMFSTERKYFWDTAHFKPYVGNMIIDRLFGGKTEIPNDFGVLVTAQNVEEHLKKVRVNRDRWRAENPGLVECGAFYQGFVALQPRQLLSSQTVYGRSVGVVETVMDKPVRSDKFVVERKNRLKIAGWAINDMMAFDEVFMVLTSVEGKGKRYYAVTARNERKDLTSIFHDANYLQAGFLLDASIENVEPGSYKLEVIQVNQQQQTEHYAKVLPVVLEIK